MRGTPCPPVGFLSAAPRHRAAPEAMAFKEICCAPDPVAWLWTLIQEKVHRKGGVRVACKTVRQPKATSALWYTVRIAEQEARAAL